jgi:hypothetical protein
MMGEEWSYNYATTYTHNDDENIEIRIAKKPTLVIPSSIWRDHSIMSSLVDGEYTTAMTIDQGKGLEFRVIDYYVPEQYATGGSAEWTKDGIKGLVKHTSSDIEKWFGIFHIHPGSGNRVSMSSVDVNCMWNWVKSAKRGVFIVSNKSSAVEAILVLEVNGVRMQIPMSVDVEWDDGAKREEFKKLLDERMKTKSLTYQYEKYWKGWSGGATKVKKGDNERKRMWNHKKHKWEFIDDKDDKGRDEDEDFSKSYPYSRGWYNEYE